MGREGLPIGELMFVLGRRIDRYLTWSSENAKESME